MNSTGNNCPYCGRDLDAMGMYADFMHYTPDGDICVESDPMPESIRLMQGIINSRLDMITL